MNGSNGVRVSTARAIGLPATIVLPAVETILKELTERPGDASLALNVQELRIPFEAMLTVPIETHVAPGGGRNEWNLAIRAAATPQLYPEFQGSLTLVSAAGHACELHLDGTYAVPFGAFGRALDMTLFRGAAQSALRRFVRDLAHRVMSLARWARFA